MNKDIGRPGMVRMIGEDGLPKWEYPSRQEEKRYAMDEVDRKWDKIEDIRNENTKLP